MKYMQPEKNLRLLKYLQDALSAAEEIHINTLGVSVGSFHVNPVKWLVERGIEIVSEALKRAIIIEPSLSISDVNKIFATRNKIAHEYDIVDPLQLYNIVNKSIPTLIEELKSIIEKLEGDKEWT